MKITVQIVAADTRSGFEVDCFLTETEAQDWIMDRAGESRESYELFLAKARDADRDADFWDFIQTHKFEDLDTFQWDEKTLEIPDA